MSADERRWPVVVETVQRHLLWLPGESSADAAERAQARDNTGLWEDAQRGVPLDGGAFARPADVDEVRDATEWDMVGPQPLREPVPFGGTAGCRS